MDLQFNSNSEISRISRLENAYKQNFADFNTVT